MDFLYHFFLMELFSFDFLFSICAVNYDEANTTPPATAIMSTYLANIASAIGTVENRQKAVDSTENLIWLPKTRFRLPKIKMKRSKAPLTVWRSFVCCGHNWACKTSREWQNQYYLMFLYSMSQRQMIFVATVFFIVHGLFVCPKNRCYSSTHLSHAVRYF